jgi:iron complex transport system permease protein
VLLGVPSIFFLSRELNAISLGEEEAIHLGVDAEKIKKFIFLITALMTAALICACGIIGFVGLIVPHAMRSLVGPDHKALIPLSALAGAAFLTACDVLSRTVMAPYEVPIGVITAAVGAPLFLFLMRRSRP